MNIFDLLRQQKQAIPLVLTRVAAAILLVLISPIIIIISIMVLVRDGAPVFFLQERVGLGGQLFKIRKFRTMTLASPQTRRVTKAGQKLRWLKLDELPQLINILCGEMSFFGPRPELEYYVKDWPANEREVILSVRPGLIDPAIIQLVDEEAILANSADPERLYRCEIMPFKQRIYLEFIENPSVWHRNALLCLQLARFMMARVGGKSNRLPTQF
jgi:lipopolysaccharide/colanic/teichoic acid biosynthesis glycosyltransferase